MAAKYTKYETARIIGARALELAFGAPPLIKVPEGTVDPIKLAELELQKGVIPITIIRGEDNKPRGSSA